VPDFLLYGATGYTGELIAREAARRGLRPRLAGRDAERVGPLARDLGLESAVVALSDAEGLERALADVPLVLHCAGPFPRTWRPMFEAALRSGRHYLDINAEWDVHDTMARRDADARAAGAMVLPGVGFDVVPTDCLAARVAAKLPGATQLAIVVQHLPWRDERGRLRNPSGSRGTLSSMLSGRFAHGRVRRGGVLVETPIADTSRRFDLGAGPTRATRFPLAEVSTLYHSTGVPNVEAYVSLPRALLLALGYLGPLLVRVPLMRLLPRGGPSAAERANGGSLVLAEARDDAGSTVVGTLATPQAYAFTVASALAAVERVLRGEANRGFQTPSTAFGADFVFDVEGVKLSTVV
jgi:short subunit dehydrogenase-like uncharacterized protein